ncbi:hypothetical protein HZH68_016201 [Vespula germanica]|uniref:Uncharacterized protein n=1 Tax=Vespula germanica TaxID=30212 RepID=A0A834J3A1_VESGE|nr:hypothetical protein HZH68_016201 [Vespula germanica]
MESTYSFTYYRSAVLYYLRLSTSSENFLVLPGGTINRRDRFKEEEEEEKGDTGDEGVKGEGKDYEFTLVVDSIDDRFYLDADDFADKFKSNHTDVGLWSNIDFPNLDFTSKIPNTVYRKKEGDWTIETYRE